MPESAVKEVVFVFLRNDGKYGLVMDSDAGRDTHGRYIPLHKSFRAIDMDTRYTAHRAVWDEAGVYADVEEKPRIAIPPAGAPPLATPKGDRRFIYYAAEYQANRCGGERKVEWFSPEQIKNWPANEIAGWVPEIMRVADLL